MENKKRVEWYTWDMMEAAVHQLGERILEDELSFSSITTIARGGLVIASLLSYKLDIPEVYVIIPDKHYPDVVFENTLFVDEIIDTGVTLQKLIDYYGVKPKRVASFHKGAESIIEPDYYINCPQQWVVYPWEIGEYDEDENSTFRNTV